MNEQIRVIEKNVAIIEHRVTVLEDAPPRINTLENTVTHLQTEVEHISTNIEEVKQSGKQLHSDVNGLRDEVRRLFGVGVGVAIIASILVGGAELYDTVLSIQEKQQAKELHNGSRIPGQRLPE